MKLFRGPAWSRYTDIPLVPNAGPSMSTEFVHNHKLFSDYYLDTLLPQREEWDGDYTGARNDLRQLLEDHLPALPTLSEAQTEEDFIRPALRALGWQFQSQVTFRRFYLFESSGPVGPPQT